MPRRRCKPLVYSRSGCPSAAPLTDAVALKLDRDGTDPRAAEPGIAVPETETAGETPG